MELKASHPRLDPQTTTTLGLIGLIYDAVPNGSRWQTFLEALVRATGSTRGTLALNGSALGTWQIVCWYGWKDEEIRLYMERYAANDPWGIHGRLREGEVCTTEELCPNDKEVLTQAQTLAYIDTFMVLAFAAGIMFMLSFVIRKNDPAPGRVVLE